MNNMIGDDESNGSLPFEIMKAIGKIISTIAKKVWDYVGSNY